MAQTRWSSVCRFCGKKGGSTTSSSGRPTRNPPTIGGKCPSSPDGKHKPEWRNE